MPISNSVENIDRKVSKKGASNKNLRLKFILLFIYSAFFLPIRSIKDEVEYQHFLKI
jgi:hypothetical protein